MVTILIMVTLTIVTRPDDGSAQTQPELPPPSWPCASMAPKANIHTYIYIRIHAYIHTYIHACIDAFIHSYIHTYIHTNMHSCWSMVLIWALMYVCQVAEPGWVSRHAAASGDKVDVSILVQGVTRAGVQASTCERNKTVRDTRTSTKHAHCMFLSLALGYQIGKSATNVQCMSTDFL